MDVDSRHVCNLLLQLRTEFDTKFIIIYDNEYVTQLQFSTLSIQPIGKQNGEVALVFCSDKSATPKDFMLEEKLS
jgi:hypothetical protein